MKKTNLHKRCTLTHAVKSMVALGIALIMVAGLILDAVPVSAVAADFSAAYSHIDSLDDDYSQNDNYEFTVTYTIFDPAPANVTNMPTSPQSHNAGTIVTVAGVPQTTSTTNNGVSGTWAFYGWNTTDVVVTGTTFTMPYNNVHFTGSWRFTPDNGGDPGDPYTVTYTVIGPAPANVTNMPTSPQSHNAGTIVTVAGIPQTTSTTNNGVSGTWTFYGWNTTDVVVTGTTFTMPHNNVHFTGSWRFTPDNGRPQMIKNPDRTVVAVGETLDWTLRGFHNYTGGEVTGFTLIDMPGKGLNFLSGSLPAFYNGQGITYEIRYRVYGSSQWSTHATGIDASSPFNFTLPQPGNLFYTDIGFFFGDVPANFALNNTIVLTFIVSADAPNNVLVNDFILIYGGRERPGDSPDQPLVEPPPLSNPPLTSPLTPPLTSPLTPPLTSPLTQPEMRANPQTGDNSRTSHTGMGLTALIGIILLANKIKRQTAA